MKYNSRMVMIPWLDADGNRNMSRLRFYGAVDHRRVKRELRKFFKKHLGRSVHPMELYQIIQKFSGRLYETA